MTKHHYSAAIPAFCKVAGRILENKISEEHSSMSAGVLAVLVEVSSRIRRIDSYVVKF